MENQKRINLVDKTPNQRCKFSANNWVEINMTHVERIAPIVKLSLCNYIYVYILVKGTKTNVGAGDDDPTKQFEEGNK